MQQWLVWRLVSQLNEYEQQQSREEPRCLVVKANIEWGNSPELFWGWLAGELQCSSDNSEVVLEDIIQLIKSQSYIFVIYKIDLLRTSTQKFLMAEFWEPLVSRLTEKRKRGEGICRLFLTENIDYQANIQIKELVSLDPWREVLFTADMDPWFNLNLVLEFLSRTAPESTRRSLEDEWLRDESLGKPEKVIKLLGQAVGLADGIEEMKRYWQLAA
jgi:hypothetical protein